MILIISISGTSCVGKSTTAEMLQEEGYPVIMPSASRLASGRQFPSLEAKDRFIYETAHQQLLDAKRIAGVSKKPVFLDRSQFDNWTFRLVFGGDLSYEHLFLQDIEALDFIWILDPADVRFKGDGVRPEDQEKLKQWHQLMLAKAKELSLPHAVLSGTPSQRLSRVLRNL